MGIAAYNRGSKAISTQIVTRDHGFQLIDDLNQIEKHPGARRPFGPVLFKYDGQRWWALDPIKGFRGYGFWFDSIREAIAGFHVTITEHNETEMEFIGVPY